MKIQRMGLPRVRTEEFLRYASEGAEGHELALVNQDGSYLVHPDLRGKEVMSPA